MTTFEEQGKFYLPWNPITTELKHDKRLFISMLQAEPYVYKITKVKNTSPKGIITFTVKQDRFEPDYDYVSLNPNNEDYGDMYADYYSSDFTPDIEPCKNDEDFDCNQLNYDKYTMVIEAVSDKVKLGSSKVLNVKIYNAVNEDVTYEYINSECNWTFELNDEEMNQEDLIIVDEEYSLKDGNKFKCKFKFNGDEKYLNYSINVTCKIENLSANFKLAIVAL